MFSKSGLIYVIESLSHLPSLVSMFVLCNLVDSLVNQYCHLVMTYELRHSLCHYIWMNLFTWEKFDLGN